MSRPRLLDLFCGAGGCSVGYHRAGFSVIGVDVNPQPRYPFGFHQADALQFLVEHGQEFDAIHASPPCQKYSKARWCPGSRGREYPDLLPATLAELDTITVPWIVENVPGAPLPWAVELCGTMFNLRVRRHRLFSSNMVLFAPPNQCRHRDGDMTVFGNCVQLCGTRGTMYVSTRGRVHYRAKRTSRAAGGQAMGIDWMIQRELSQAIPPAYTEYLGRQLLTAIGVTA